MSDYTPSLEEAREQYWAASGDPRRDSGAWGEFDRMIETVRAEERERYDPAKDERLARYMALVMPLGYASASEIINSLTALMNVEARAHEIAEKARQDEREKAAQIAISEVGPSAETDRHGRVIAARIRNQEAGE